MCPLPTTRLVFSSDRVIKGGDKSRDRKEPKVVSDYPELEVEWGNQIKLNFPSGTTHYIENDNLVQVAG